MQRSRRIDNYSDNASVGGNSVATASSISTASSNRRASKRHQNSGSFASATAASLAQGGPTSEAPPARSAIASNSTAGRRMALPKQADNEGGGSQKENAKKRSGTGTPSKITKEGAPAAAAPIHSPTPYWKVLEERGNRPSPRKTRSAAKKASSTSEMLAKGMQDLDELDPESSSSEEDEKIDPMTLHFSPPDKELHAIMAKNAKKRRDAELELQMIRAEKVRKAGSMKIMDNAHSASRQVSRAPKRVKKGHANAKSGDQPIVPSMMTATAVGPSTEEVRQIMQQSLAEHNSHRIEELIAKAAAAERDAAHYKQRYEELEEQTKAKEGKEGELSTKCVEQQALMDEYERRIDDFEREEKELEIKHGRDLEEAIAEMKEMDEELARVKREHALELQKAADGTASIEKLCGEKKVELDLMRTKLSETVHAKEKLEALRSNSDESNGELLKRIVELEKIESDLKAELTNLNATNESHQDTIASLKSDVTSHLATISNHECVIAELESNLASSKKDLESANSKMKRMHSPRSRDALEQGFTKEVDELELSLAAAEKEKTDLQQQMLAKEKENQTLKQDMDEIQAQNEELRVKLTESNDLVEAAKRTTATTKLEKDELSEQVVTANAKVEENEQQLEEIAMENEQLLTKLESMKQESQRQIKDLESKSQQSEASLQAKCDDITNEKESLTRELHEARNTISELQAQVNNLEEELSETQQITSTLETEKQKSDQKLTELSRQLQTLTNHLEAAQVTIANLEAKLRARDEYCEQFTSIEQKLIQEKRVLNEIRRDLHNRVIQLSGNIRVFVRVRPLVEGDRQLQVQQKPSNNSNRRLTTSRPSSASGRPSSRGSLAQSSSGSGSRPSSRGSMMSSSSHRSLSSSQGEDDMAAECPFHFPSITDRNTQNASANQSLSPNYTSFNDLTKQTIELTEPYKDRGGLNPRRKKWKYGFDRVFHQGNGQEDIWQGAAPLVQSCIDGFHVCMFAYGQTSSGKTHTMIGDAQNRGLIPRAVAKIFAAKKEIEQGRGEEVSVDISVELLEIYNEEVRDLLDDNAGPQGQLIKLKLSSNEAVGNVKVTARDEQEVEGILQLAQERRCVKATKANAESSRSHLLFTIHFDVLSTSCGDESVASRSGCLHFCDLAGSERIDKSGSHHGQLLTEAKHINTSLSALSLVIEKLQSKSDHIPYRDSKLTYLLRNSLGGDSKTLAIVCCNPQKSHFSESLNSIRFAAKASNVELKETNKVDV